MFTVFAFTSKMDEGQNHCCANPNKCRSDADDEPILLNQKIYNLNKSKSKTVAVGLSPKCSLKPVVKISGNKYKQCAIFDESEWENFLKNQGIITNYFIVQDEFWQPIVGKKFTIEFSMYNKVKIVKIHTEKNLDVILAYESLCWLWELLPLITYKLDMLRKQQFDAYYKSVVNGNVFENYNPLSKVNTYTLTNSNNENVYSMMEMMHYFPDKIIAECEDNTQRITSVLNTT